MLWRKESIRGKIDRATKKEEGWESEDLMKLYYGQVRSM